MRFFTDKNGNFNWAAIGGICAAVGAIIAAITFLAPQGGKDVATKNIQTVIGDYVIGTKVEGITLEQYEEGLRRREEEIVEILKDATVSAQDAEALRATLTKIDGRQADLQSSFKDVKDLTAEIRTYHANIANKDLLQEAILKIFDGDVSAAADKALDAGIPIKTVSTIESPSTVFQPIKTEADFLRYVVGRELQLSNDVNYVRKYGRNGSINGYNWGGRTGTGSWAFVEGKYCEEFTHAGKHYPQYCPEVEVTRSAVKFEYSDGKTGVYSIK